jgi:hypothetical protein
VSVHKCRHCGDEIRSRRLWLPRPADWPGGILTPPPFETVYVSLEDGDPFCRGLSFLLPAEAEGFGRDILMDDRPDRDRLAHQPMTRIGV